MNKIDWDAVKKIEDVVSSKLDAMSSLEQMVAYKLLNKRGLSLSWIEAELHKQWPRREVKR